MAIQWYPGHMHKASKEIKQVLPQIMNVLEPGGRVAVISYHSLEDRIVKQFFKESARTCICPAELPECRCEHAPLLKIITKKIVTPTEEEIKKIRDAATPTHKDKEGNEERNVRPWLFHLVSGLQQIPSRDLRSCVGS